MLSDATRNSLVNAIKDMPWYSVIVDTTSDICRIDQISIVVRWVDLHNVMIKETFLGFSLGLSCSSHYSGFLDYIYEFWLLVII